MAAHSAFNPVSGSASSRLLSTTGAARPSWYAWSHREAQTAHRSPGFNPGNPYIGIGVSEYYSADFPIEFTLEDIGGPSAGLLFATGIVDKLTPEDLADLDAVSHP